MPRNCLQRHSFDGRPKNDWYLEVSDCLWLPTFFLRVWVCVCVCVEQEKTVFVDLSRPVLSVPRSPEQRGSIVSLSCVLRALFVVDRVYTDIHSLYSNLSR